MQLDMRPKIINIFQKHCNPINDFVSLKLTRCINDGSDYYR